MRTHLRDFEHTLPQSFCTGLLGAQRSLSVGLRFRPLSPSGYFSLWLRTAAIPVGTVSNFYKGILWAGGSPALSSL